MSFQMIRLVVTLVLALHFLARLRVAFGGGLWPLPATLALAALILPQSWPGHLAAWPKPAADFLLYAGPLILGYLFFFLLAALALDLARLAVGAVGALSGHCWWGLPAVKKAGPPALILAAALTLNAYFIAYHPRLVKVELPTTRLPAGVEALRIVQVSDVHLGRFVGPDDLKYILDLVEGAKPDLVVFTGDILDTRDKTGLEREAALLAALKPRCGVFAVLGNHENYSGLKASLDFYRRSGLKLLRGRAEEICGLVVAGVDDESFGGTGEGEPAGKVLGAFRDDPRFILFLKHRPGPAPGAAGLFDLQLSGHTHGGQIWPFHFLAARANGVLHGLNPTPGRGFVYTSRGAGFWGAPFRFLAPPEVTLMEIRESVNIK